MHLLRLEAQNFRNLHGSIELAPGLNVIHGPNAQGKTNWLEAVYLLATTKSFRTSHPRETINHDAPEALLRGTVAQGNLTKDLQLLLTDATKQTFINGKRESVVRYRGNLDAIAFTADEMDVVRGAPEARRTLLDRGIFAVQPSYLGVIEEYNRVLKQKNALLRAASDADDPLRFQSLLEPWNDQLVALGLEIHRARTAYLARLQAALNPTLFQAERIAVRYKSSLEGKGDLSDYAGVFRARLAARLKNEIAVGYALVGPHRDDLEILFDGYEIARYGSSGQQRSALLILDLAQLSVYHQTFEEYPVFIIDDLDAELDRARIEILLDYLSDKAQTLVTTSKRTIADRYRHRAAVFFVAAGRAVVEPPDTAQNQSIPPLPAPSANEPESFQTTNAASARNAKNDDDARPHTPFEAQPSRL